MGWGRETCAPKDDGLRLATGEAGKLRHNVMAHRLSKNHLITQQKLPRTLGFCSRLLRKIHPMPVAPSLWTHSSLLLPMTTLFSMWTAVAETVLDVAGGHVDVLYHPSIFNFFTAFVTGRHHDLSSFWFLVGTPQHRGNL